MSSQPIPIAVVGVGLVGSEFLSQLLSLPAPSPYNLVAVVSSKTLLYEPAGLTFSPSGWKPDLSKSSTRLDLMSLVAELSKARKTSQKVVFVDNTSSDHVASLYPQLLHAGVSVVTPNKKAFSGDLALFSEIVSASRDSGARFLNESTVGAGLPIVSTLKEMVATGDQVRNGFVLQSNR
jgi:homoserine dehydrogenase